jgi:hypothetical protein
MRPSIGKVGNTLIDYWKSTSDKKEEKKSGQKSKGKKEE